MSDTNWFHTFRDAEIDVRDGVLELRYLSKELADLGFTKLSIDVSMIATRINDGLIVMGGAVSNYITDEFDQSRKSIRGSMTPGEHMTDGQLGSSYTWDTGIAP